MATLSIRLLALELRSKSHSYPNGLESWDAVCKVGGPNALVERLDNGTTTDEDRAIIANTRGGEKWVMGLKTSLDHFYGR